MDRPNADVIDSATATQTSSANTSRARSVALVGLSIAIMAVCSWIIIPIGPIPFTLQMFAIPLIICILRPGQAVAAAVGYLVLGAVGLPLFSGMRGGLGVIMGPTGGFLLGYLPGVIVAAILLYLTAPAAERYRQRQLARTAAEDVRPSTWQRMRSNLLGCAFQLIAGLLFTVVSYVTGWAQFMLVAGVGPEAAFVACIAPFIVPDIVKVLVAVTVAQPVRAAIYR